MKKSRELGMQTFDQALFDLYEADKISYEDALRNADSVNDLRLNIKLNSKHAKNRDFSTGDGPPRDRLTLHAEYRQKKGRRGALSLSRSLVSGPDR